MSQTFKPKSRRQVQVSNFTHTLKKVNTPDHFKVITIVGEVFTGIVGEEYYCRQRCLQLNYKLNC